MDEHELSSQGWFKDDIGFWRKEDSGTVLDGIPDVGQIVDPEKPPDEATLKNQQLVMEMRVRTQRIADRQLKEAQRKHQRQTFIGDKEEFTAAHLDGLGKKDHLTHDETAFIKMQMDLHQQRIQQEQERLAKLNPPTTSKPADDMKRQELKRLLATFTNEELRALFDKGDSNATT
jgi:hypothetical protein